MPTFPKTSFSNEVHQVFKNFFESIDVIINTIILVLTKSY